MIHYHRSPGHFWIRVLGRGISIADRRIHPPLFSERYGYRKVLRIGPYAIEWLNKTRLNG